MLNEMFADGSLQNYIEQNLEDPWQRTPFEGYVFMSPKQKGEFGERFTSKYLTHLGCNVKRAKTSTAGHDRVVDDILTEIKFSLAIRNRSKGGVIFDKFIINHVSSGKDWERLVFVGINENEEDLRVIWFTKEDFNNHIASSNSLFKVQQGGKGVGNDDYICTNVKNLLECEWVKSISVW
tara:strand:- start:760 stop:1299 length:540 start_codon:yes stop_codon:yes gene_type:complete